MKSSKFLSKLFISQLLFILFFNPTSPIYSQINGSVLNKDQLIKKLDEKIPQLLDSADVPGLSLAVIKDGKVLYTQAYGVKNMDTKEALNTNTIFEAASLSKPVFAYACLKFVEEGLLDLDKPLYQYLPYEDIQRDQRYKLITARMILSHTSGFPNWRENDSLRIIFEPGQRFGYSGEGFFYLQKVLEKISNKDLNEIMTEKVFTPLGMKNSTYIWKTNIGKNFATPHRSFNNPMEKLKRENPVAAASLHTTAQDYATFIIAILNNTGLKKKTIREMLSPQIQAPQNLHDPSSPLSTSLFWGLGFGLEQNKKENYFFHSGNNYTFKCFVIASQKTKSGLVYFTNSSNGFSIAGELVQATIGGEHPALDVPGFEGYKTSAFLFKKNILKIGVKKSIEPFINENGKLSGITELEINNIGYDLLSIKNTQLAKEVFEININAYPNSNNAYDSYAEACLRNGDYQLAGENYLKAYERNPNYKKAKYISDQILNENSKKGNTEFIIKGYADAKIITLAGNFNKWDGFRTIFFKKGNVWTCNLDLAPGKYVYKIVVDGEWMLDPGNPTTLEEYGFTNSVLEVK